MPGRPRLVYRKRPTARAELDWEQPGADVTPAPEAWTREQASGPWAREQAPEAGGTRDAMREVQMENIHPLRLRLLLEIERTRSISAAAQTCGIGQPSASMHLRNLEATLGHRLVTRSGRGSSLTAAGKVVASHGARMLATLDSMRRAVDALDVRGGGELTIGASLTPSVVLLPPILGQFCDRYPGVTVKLRTLPSEAVVQEVARGAVDLGVAGEVRTAEPVARKQVVLDELIGIAAPGLIDSDHGWITIGQLARHRLLLGAEGSSTRTITEGYLALAGYRPAPFWEFNSYETVTRAVREGLGVSFVSRLLVRMELERGELSAFRVSGVEQMLRPIHALHDPARELSPETSAFMALVADARRVMTESHAAPGPVSPATSWGVGS